MPQPESEAVRVLRDFRLRMDAEDTRLMMDLGNRWLGVERSLSSEISALAEEFSRRTAAGEQITQQMIWKAERYQVIQRQLETEVKKYNKDYAVNRIVDAQETAAALGVDAAQASIFASYPSPLSANFNRVNVAAVESLAGFAGDGTPLKRLLDKAAGDASDGIVSAMLAGLGSGQGAVAIAKSMADGMGLGLDRSILIARTETQRAYRSGTVQQYRESGVVSGFMRLVKKDGACLSCLALDGELFELEEELDDHPNGRCTAVPIVRGLDAPTWEHGDAWLANQDEAKQREILGPARFEMYANGTPLSAFATKTHNDVWGSAPQVRSIKELQAGGLVAVRDTVIKDISMSNFEEKITMQDFETAGVYSRDGKLIFQKDGGRSNVSFTNEEMAQMKDAILTHNHPNNSPFSEEDILLLGKTKAYEIRAITDQYVYTMQNPSKVDFLRDWSYLRKTASNELFHEISVSGVDVPQKEFVHRLWDKIAQKAGLTYRRELR